MAAPPVLPASAVPPAAPRSAGGAARPVLDTVPPAAVQALLADGTVPALVFQPLVDLRTGDVVGYEALSRFAGPHAAPPDHWFAVADRLGRGAELEARVVHAALRARESLPDGRFLTVNVSPHLLAEPALEEVLTSGRDLRRIVLELTEHVAVEDDDRMLQVLDRARACGAAVALDDAGAGYSGLRQLALVRPQIVKLDRTLVDHADRDEAKLALAELLGDYAGRLDACLLAEGVERFEELEALARLGVPLGQGYLFARPATGWTDVAPRVRDQIQALAEQVAQVEQVASLLEAGPTVLDAALRAGPLPPELADADTVVVVDAASRPVGMLRAGLRAKDGAAAQVVPVSLRVPADSGLIAVARRAMTRASARRFDPVVCTDEHGRYRGLLRVERLTLRLAELAATAPTPSRRIS